MIQTTIILGNSKVSFTITNNYIGKKVHALIYIAEEITESVEALPTQKPSNFFRNIKPRRCSQNAIAPTGIKK